MKTMRKVVSTLLLVCLLATLLSVSAFAAANVKFDLPDQSYVRIEQGTSHTFNANFSQDDSEVYNLYWMIDGNRDASCDGLASVSINGNGYSVGKHTISVVAELDSNHSQAAIATTTFEIVEVKPEPDHIVFNDNYIKLTGYGSWGPNVATVYPTGCDQTVTWSTGDASKAVVDSATGLVTATGKGTTYITATASNGVSASFTVEVEIPAVAITLDKSYIDMTKGDKENIVATVQNGATSTVLTWRSSNNAVATVDSSGLVEAIAAGTATITASTTDGSAISNECLVTVKDNAKKAPVTVTVTPVNVDLVLGQSTTLTATLTIPTGTAGTYIDHWYCNSPAVSLQSNNNTCVIKGVQTTGSTPVEVRAYAHDGGVYGYALVTVSQADGLELAVSNTSISNGKTATVSVANAVNGETFSWDYSPKDASIISNAIVKGNSLVLTAGEMDGSITVTCTSKMDASRTATAIVGVNGVDPYGNAKLTPKSATWTKGDGDLSFQVQPNAYWMYLDNQYLNNKSTSQVVYWNGTLTLKAAYLATLANGTHTLKVYTAYDDYNNPTGLVYGNIYINGNAATGSASATYGDNAHVKGTASNLYFNAANPIKDVYISNKWIDPANYALSTDGKTLTLNANFLNQLAYGSYTMTLNNDNGATQTTNFRIVTANYAPSTGDENNIGLWIAIMILSGTGVVALLPRRKKNMQ